jgi:hypothetical protein
VKSKVLARRKKGRPGRLQDLKREATQYRGQQDDTPSTEVSRITLAS